MTTHALAHRDCGGNIEPRDVRVQKEDGLGFPYMSNETVLVCKSCEETIEDIFDEAYTSADDIEWLVARVIRGDADIELIDEDPKVWARKTSDEQLDLRTFENKSLLREVIDQIRGDSQGEHSSTPHFVGDTE